jgi:hypothetical protein
LPDLGSSYLAQTGWHCRQQLPLELQGWSIAKSSPVFCGILCPAASIATVFSQTAMETGVTILGCEGYEGLPAGTAFKPIQIQDPITGVPQPSANVSYLKRTILRTEVAIRQLGYFLSSARLLDLVQCSLHPFIETGIRVRRLAHLLLSCRKAELIKPPQVVICFSALSLIKDEGLKRNFLGPTGSAFEKLPEAQRPRRHKPPNCGSRLVPDPRGRFAEDRLNC